MIFVVEIVIKKCSTIKHFEKHFSYEMEQNNEKLEIEEILSWNARDKK